MKTPAFFLALALACAGPVQAQQGWNFRNTVIQKSPDGWRLVGMTRNAVVWWIKPSSIKGDASKRSVRKMVVDPDSPLKLSESWVHIDCPKAIQTQSSGLRSTQPLLINKGSVWETIGKIICPAGTYGTASGLRPQAPLR